MKHKGICNIGANPQDLIRRVQNINPTLANELSALALPWYRIKNSATDDDTTEVLVYDTIGGWFGVEASEFVHELSDITTSNINVRINSPGGSVYDGIAIYNALMMHPANINVYVDSLAASIASVIAMAGDTVTMLPGSQMMIHDALMYTVGNAQTLREDADFLDKQSDNIAGFYAAKAGGEPAEWRARMLDETWFFAQEAVDLGLADKIYAKPSTQDDDDEEDTEVTDNVSTKRLMGFRHPLMNRGFNYPGRKRAPAPAATVRPVSKPPKDKPLAEMTDAEFSRHIAALRFGSE